MYPIRLILASRLVLLSSAAALKSEVLNFLHFHPVPSDPNRDAYCGALAARSVHIIATEMLDVLPGRDRGWHSHQRASQEHATRRSPRADPGACSDLLL